MVATKPRVRASTGVARELGASAMHRWEDYVACGAPQRARRSAMGGLSPQTFQGYTFENPQRPTLLVTLSMGGFC